MKNRKILILKKFTSPANEIPLHKRRSNRKLKNIFFFKCEKCRIPANEFLLHRYINNEQI